MEHLLAPISEEAPSGEYLKGNRSKYRELRNAFNQAQSSYRQLTESPDAMQDDALLAQNAEHWQLLSEQCEATLSSVAKDVEVLGWYCMAKLFERHPIQALEQALGVFVALVESYGDTLQPRPPVNKLKADDEAGQAREYAELRTRPLLQLLGESDGSGLLSMPLQNVPLIGDISYSLYYSAERSGELEAIKEQAQQYCQTNRAEIVEQLQLLASCQQHVDSLDALFKAQCEQVGTSPINFRFLRQLFERLLSAMRYLLEPVLTPWPLDPVEEASEIAPDQASSPAAANSEPSPSEAPAAEAATPAQPAITTASVAVDSSVLANRDQAFNQLRQIADYFRQTEPHSPVYLLLERAIRWGYLPLPELLAEMVGDNQSVMGRIENLAGLESNQRTAVPAVAMAQPSPASQAIPEKVAPAAVTEAPTTAPEPDSSATEQTEQQGDAGNISSFEW